MLQSCFYQMPMGAIDPDVLRLPPGSFERRLRADLPLIVSLRDFEGWYSESEGAPTCCPIMLTGMLLLGMRYKLLVPAPSPDGIVEVVA